MNKYFLLATCLLAGTIIGAGIFSLPYIFSRLGAVGGFFYLLVFASVYAVLYVMYANLLLSREGRHDFFFLSDAYLPKFFSKIASLIILGGLILALVVYLALVPTFSRMMFPGMENLAILIFWISGSFFMFARLKWLGIAEFLGIVSIVIIAGLIFVLGFSAPAQSIPVAEKLTPALFFLPFGPLLFSFAGRSAVSQVVREYKKARSAGRTFSIKISVALGVIIPAVVYLLFVFGVLRLSQGVSRDAFGGLRFLSPSLQAFLGVLGLIVLWTSYIMLGTNVRDILAVDVKTQKWVWIAVPLFAPVMLYLLGLKDFLSALSFTGGIFIALESAFMIMMWRKAFPTHRFRWFAYPLCVVFVVAFIHEIIQFFL